MRPLLRWNFSSRAQQLSGADAIVISIPKSGRTWLRAFLCAYFCKRAGLEMTLTPERLGSSEIPHILYSHDRFEQRTKGTRAWDRLRGKYLVPGAELRKAKIILLARDPRDAFVSHYLQLTRRTPETAQKLRDTSASELLRDARYGIRSIIAIMNDWLMEFSSLHGFTLARYESLRSQPEEHFRRLLDAIGETSPDTSALADALAFSEFAQMKKMETAGMFDSKILQPGNLRDPESFKVRRGKVGGYADYLTPDDQAYAAVAMRDLEATFKYS